MVKTQSIFKPIRKSNQPSGDSKERKQCEYLADEKAFHTFKNSWFPAGCRSTNQKSEKMQRSRTRRRKAGGEKSAEKRPIKTIQWSSRSLSWLKRFFLSSLCYPPSGRNISCRSFGASAPIKRKITSFYYMFILFLIGFRGFTGFYWVSPS